MAKKRTATKDKQTRIPGTFDPVPKEVEAARDEYVEAKREKAAWLVTMNDRRNRLIEMMREHDIERLEIDDGEKILVLEEDWKLRIESKKDDGTDDADAT